VNQVELQTYMSTAVRSAKFTLESQRQIKYPYYDMITKTTHFSVAMVGVVKDEDEAHVVALSYRLDAAAAVDFRIWCGDKFLEAKNLSDDEATKRVEELCAALPGSGSDLSNEILEQFGTMPESAACTFWTGWRRDKTLCGHTAHFLACLREDNPNFIDAMQAEYNAVTAGGTSAAVSDTFTLSELAFRCPVLFEGDRGAGKTVEARSFARKGGYPLIEIGGHEGIEAPDLLGYLVPIPGEGRQMVWKDGGLSEAFRAASKGTKVVLVLDELLRIRQRELSILLTALSPDEGVYRLRTGRIVDVQDGVAKEETLECPVGNICVVGTTNVGAEYAVDSIDPALAERFIVIRKDTERATLTRILGEVMDAKAFKKRDKLVEKVMTFYDKMLEARKAGLVSDVPTTRTLVRSVELAKTERDIPRGIRSHILLWVARDVDGHPIEEQVEAVKKLLDRAFKGK